MTTRDEFRTAALAAGYPEPLVTMYLGDMESAADEQFPNETPLADWLADLALYAEHAG